MFRQNRVLQDLGSPDRPTRVSALVAAETAPRLAALAGSRSRDFPRSAPCDRPQCATCIWTMGRVRRLGAHAVALDQRAGALVTERGRCGAQRVVASGEVVKARAGSGLSDSRERCQTGGPRLTGSRISVEQAQLPWALKPVSYTVGCNPAANPASGVS